MIRKKEEEVPRVTWALSALNGKWKLKILVEMRTGPIRVSELQRTIAGATKKMLIDSLRALEADGVIERRELSGPVRHVEYGIAESLRETTCSLIDLLADWSRIIEGRRSSSNTLTISDEESPEDEH